MSFRHTSGAGWGTTYHITYCATSDLSDSVVAEMRRVELSLSMFDAESTVSHINRGETAKVDSMFLDVYNISRYVNQISRGAFDPTVGPLVDLWGFGRKTMAEGSEPDSAQVAATLAHVGLSHTAISQLTLATDVDGVQFDFSAVAKGYGVDRVAEMFRRNGVKDFMVEIGGEVVTSGSNPDGKVWRIQIDTPSSANPGDSSLQVIELENCAVATSGNYRNYRLHADGSSYGHTISPITGYPYPNSTLSATVIAPNCALADALATACMALPAADAADMIKRVDNVKAILVQADAAGYKVINIP
jgi:thiamine biosynthesis lipoprotein